MLAFDNMSDRPIQGDTEWTRHDVVLDVPASARRITFGVLLGGPGTVWIDGVRLDVVASTVPTTDAKAPPSAPRVVGFEGD